MESDIWCTVLDMGGWDIIFEESSDRRVCELFIEINATLFDKPLEIKMKKDVKKYPNNLPIGYKRD